jgi:mono/diheme cytochrome c family protein
MKCALLVLALAACDLRKPDPSLSRMLEQKRADAFEATTAFPDGKVLQAPPPNTIARDDDRDEPAPPVDRALVELGRARYEMACANCHGIAGDGRSFVAEKMTLRKPPSLLDGDAYAQARIFAATTNGYGLMPALAHLLSRRERWAVAAYVNALQLRRAKAADLSPALRARLEKETP